MKLRGSFAAFGLLLSLPFIGVSDAAGQTALTLEDAERIVAAAETEATRNGWNVTIVVTDGDGIPILARRLDGAAGRSWEFAWGKALTVVSSGLSTADYATAVSAGTASAYPNAVPIAGGLPISVDGTIVGAVAVSGVRPDQDLQTAEAGLAAFRR